MRHRPPTLPRPMLDLPIDEPSTVRRFANRAPLSSRRSHGNSRRRCRFPSPALRRRRFQSTVSPSPGGRRVDIVIRGQEAALARPLSVASFSVCSQAGGPGQSTVTTPPPPKSVTVSRMKTTHGDHLGAVPVTERLRRVAAPPCVRHRSWNTAPRFGMLGSRAPGVGLVAMRVGDLLHTSSTGLPKPAASHASSANDQPRRPEALVSESPRCRHSIPTASVASREDLPLRPPGKSTPSGFRFPAEPSRTEVRPVRRSGGGVLPEVGDRELGDDGSHPLSRCVILRCCERPRGSSSKYLFLRNAYHYRLEVLERERAGVILRALHHMAAA